MEKEQGILVVSPPRCGTHMMVDSLASTLQRHSTRISNYSKSFWDHPTVKREDAIVGVHTGMHDEKFLDYSKNKKIIIMDRNPIGQALSIISMYNKGIIPDWDTRNKFDIDALKKCKPNSQTFIDYLYSKEFQEYREVIKGWPQYAEVFSYDKIARDDEKEIARLSNYIGKNFVKKSVKDTKDKYVDGIVFLGDPDLWKTIVSQEVASEVAKIFPDYDTKTYNPSPTDGDWLFKQLLV
jgi:hypothetical protein